ncbi:MAG: hypothetical protein ACRDPY_08100 [Streptosporangiaceae bacterium]
MTTHYRWETTLDNRRRGAPATTTFIDSEGLQRRAHLNTREQGPGSPR